MLNFSLLSINLSRRIQPRQIKKSSKKRKLFASNDLLLMKMKTLKTNKLTWVITLQEYNLTSSVKIICRYNSWELMACITFSLKVLLLSDIILGSISYNSFPDIILSDICIGNCYNSWFNLLLIILLFWGLDSRLFWYAYDPLRPLMSISLGGVAFWYEEI